MCDERGGGWEVGGGARACWRARRPPCASLPRPRPPPSTLHVLITHCMAARCPDSCGLTDLSMSIYSNASFLIVLVFQSLPIVQHYFG